MLKKIWQVSIAVSIAASAPLFSMARESFQSLRGVSIELSYRSLEPGEVILVTQKETPDVVGMTVHFLDRSYNAARRGPASDSFALVGLDLEVKPGSYVMDISLEKSNGGKEDVQREILILPKRFPEKKFRVRPESLNPPPQIMDRVRKESDLMETIYRQITPEWLAEGEFVIPFEAKAWPNFGQRRIYNNVPRSIHSGVDILAPWGSPIHASNSGRVVLARDMVMPGRAVIIDHGMGLYTFYCHLSRIKVKEGDFVKKGDLIAISGNTGRSTGPHLHWAVKLQDTRIDPFALTSLQLE